ncbi:MAG: hypothetical protein VYA71_05970, partial [Pseudomonadota bacterium]|nr:hypothetical protein [Pseudomonadota bacterium]
WPKEDLQKLLKRNPTMDMAMNSVCTSDLTRNLGGAPACRLLPGLKDRDPRGGGAQPVGSTLDAEFHVLEHRHIALQQRRFPRPEGRVSCPL